MKWRSVLWLGLDRFLTTPARRWAMRIVFWALFLFLVFPYFLSRVITEPPDVAWSSATPEDFHLPHEPFSVASFDGLNISCWWIPSRTQNSLASPSRGGGTGGELRTQNKSSIRNQKLEIRNSIRKPVVLFVHGLGDSKAGVLVNAQFLHERGYSCCLIDLRNHGESDRRLVTLGAHEARDIEAVLEWLRRNKGAKAFVLWGVSLGATSSLIAAVGEPDVDGLVLEACYESMRKTVDRHRRLYFGWIPRQPFIPLTLSWFRWRTGVSPDEIDLVRAASGLKRGKMFLICGEKDVRAPAGASREILNASAIPCELWVMPGIDHDSLGGHPEYEARIAKFLDEVAQSQMLEKKPSEKKK